MKKKLSLKQLEEKRAALFDKLSTMPYFTKGSVVKLRKPCVYPNCKKCEEGTKHPAMYFSRKINYKTKITYLPKGTVTEFRKAVENYSKAKNILDDIAEIDSQILILKHRKK